VRAAFEDALSMDNPIYPKTNPVLRYRSPSHFTAYPQSRLDSMSSPSKRETPASQSATPRRGLRNPEALRSSPVLSLGPDDQLRFEASQASQRDVTPANQVERLQSEGLAAQSSPLFFQSSPAKPSPVNSRNGATPRASAMTMGGWCPNS